MKKPYKPSKRDTRLQQREEKLIEAKRMPQDTSKQRQRKAEVIRKLWEMDNRSDHYYIPNFESRRTNDLDLARYIESLGDNK